MTKHTCTPGTLLSPLPAVMVSCGTGENANILTIAWTGIINSTPPMTYVSVRKSRHSHQLIAEQREFVINLTTEALAFATDYCGVKSGREVNKWKETGLTPIPCTQVACPMIGESPVNLECKVQEVREYPSHDMFVAEIVAVHVDEALLNEKGRFRMEDAGLLTYIHGQYYGIRPHSLGCMGFSVMKPKTKKRRSRQAHQARIEKNRGKRGDRKQRG